jgi:hypothetical protein
MFDFSPFLLKPAQSGCDIKVQQGAAPAVNHPEQRSVYTRAMSEGKRSRKVASKNQAQLFTPEHSFLLKQLWLVAGFGRCPPIRALLCVGHWRFVASADYGICCCEVTGFPDSRSQLLRPAPRIAAVNDPPEKPELFPNIGPITANVVF